MGGPARRRLLIYLPLGLVGLIVAALFLVGSAEIDRALDYYRTHQPGWKKK